MISWVWLIVAALAAFILGWIVGGKMMRSAIERLLQHVIEEPKPGQRIRAGQLPLRNPTPAGTPQPTKRKR